MKRLTMFAALSSFVVSASLVVSQESCPEVHDDSANHHVTLASTQVKDANVWMKANPPPTFYETGCLSHKTITRAH